MKLPFLRGGCPLRSGDKLFSLIKRKNCKSTRVCVCVYVKVEEEKVGRTCKDNFHELGLTVSLRYNKFSRIIIIPRFRTASNFRQIFSREVGRVISGLSKLPTSLRLISTTFSLHSLCLRLPSFVKKFISPSLSLLDLAVFTLVAVKRIQPCPPLLNRVC